MIERGDGRVNLGGGTLIVLIGRPSMTHLRDARSLFNTKKYGNTARGGQARGHGTTTPYLSRSLKCGKTFGEGRPGSNPSPLPTKVRRKAAGSDSNSKRERYSGSFDAHIFSCGICNEVWQMGARRASGGGFRNTSERERGLATGML